MDKKKLMKQYKADKRSNLDRYADVYSAIDYVPDDATVEELEFHRFLLRMMQNKGIKVRYSEQ